eukprot:TRINITY_DN8933_c1_g1_i2.p2 TRINITY_DN8933_c1_g1~~TRINITY_DN8933_c1_g1_i2.p2  ORF type:complete len:208 (-),score=18.43 TRINITY_DN8933_c1_g1_i2:467-1090(-)
MSSEQTQPKEYKRISLPKTQEEWVQYQIWDWINNSCIVKGIGGVVGGGICGVMFGLLFGTMDMETTHDPDKKMGQVLREMAKATWIRCGQYARSMAVFGAVYFPLECYVEKFRAKHDLLNPTIGGCLAGAYFGYGGGLTGMCAGCAFVGGMSAAIDHFLIDSEAKPATPPGQCRCDCKYDEYREYYQLLWLQRSLNAANIQSNVKDD